MWRRESCVQWRRWSEQLITEMRFHKNSESSDPRSYCYGFNAQKSSMNFKSSSFLFYILTFFLSLGLYFVFFERQCDLQMVRSSAAVAF